MRDLVDDKERDLADMGNKLNYEKINADNEINRLCQERDNLR